MVVSSVKARKLRPDAHVLPQYTRERAALRCALEAREAAARVGATAGLASTGDEDAFAGREAE
jgi:hypothetical protein